MAPENRNECIAFPILSRYIARIREGKKRWEFRRRKPARAFLRGFLVDLGQPVSVIGEFRPGRILTASPDEIWRQTKRSGGVFEAEYKAYAGDRKQMTAVEITYLALYKQAYFFDPVTYWKLHSVPQSFVYVPLPPWPFGDPSGIAHDLFNE